MSKEEQYRLALQAIWEFNPELGKWADFPGTDEEWEAKEASAWKLVADALGTSNEDSMKNRECFTKPEELAAYDEGYREGSGEAAIADVRLGNTREEVALQLIKQIGVVAGLQDRMRKAQER